MRTSSCGCLLFVLGVATLGVTPPAQAAATATASTGLMSWTLTDLDSGDGISPSFALDTEFSGVGSVLPTASNFVNTELPGSYTPVAIAASNAYGAGSARIVPTGAQASATTEYSPSEGESAYTSFYAKPISLSFTLSPHTQILVSVPVDLAASTTRGGNATYYEIAIAYAQLYQSSADPVTGTLTSSTGAQRQATATHSFDSLAQTYLGQSQSNPGTVQILFSNQASLPLSGVLTFDVTASAISYLTAPVPENGTLSLMAAGLLLTGALLRRRQRLA